MCPKDGVVSLKDTGLKRLCIRGRAVEPSGPECGSKSGEQMMIYSEYKGQGVMEIGPSCQKHVFLLLSRKKVLDVCWYSLWSPRNHRTFTRL